MTYTDQMAQEWDQQKETLKAKKKSDQKKKKHRKLNRKKRRCMHNEMNQIHIF